jgi:predicted DNA-binding transcriptional regulator YafY
MIPDFPTLVQTHLFWGRDRAVTIGRIAEDMDASRRSVEQAIEQLRRDGSPICTGSPGVWLSVDSRELYRNADALRSRGIKVLIGARALRATARRFERVQQTTLFGEVA